MATNLEAPVLGVELSAQAQTVVDAVLELSHDDQVGVMQVLEMQLLEPGGGLRCGSREEFAAELRRRIDDYDSGRDPGFSEEEVAAKIKSLLESFQ